MEGNKPTKLQKFNSTEELVDFFENHDMGDIWNQMPEANFDVDIKQRNYLISVDESLLLKLVEIAGLQQVSVETLINSWLREKVLLERN